MGDVDVVLCGKQAVDGDTAQVGPEMAALLDIPYATFVKKIELPDGGSLKATRQTDEGTEVWKLPTPALLTVIKEIGEPRVPSLRHKMRAKKAEIPAGAPRSRARCGPRRSLRFFYQVVRVFSPPGAQTASRSRAPSRNRPNGSSSI